jgi:hypothetical protein
MSDPTHNWLEAAILDQAIAGLFGNKAYAFVAVLRSGPKPWGVGVAVVEERGYHPIDTEIFSFAKREEAEDFCDGMNRHIGLSRLGTVRIIASSMRKTGRGPRRAKL